MDNIRLPEDFTDRVMHRIEVRERAEPPSSPQPSSSSAATALT